MPPSKDDRVTPDQLRELGRRSALMIRQRPADFADAVRWFGSIKVPPQKRGEIDQRLVRKLLRAWTEARAPFEQLGRGEVFARQTRETATRVALVGALIFEPDFDGSEAGLPAMPWRLPGSDKALMDCRSWALARIEPQSEGDSADTPDWEIFRQAVRYLETTLTANTAPVSATDFDPQEAQDALRRAVNTLTEAESLRVEAEARLRAGEEEGSAEDSGSVASVLRRMGELKRSFDQQARPFATVAYGLGVEAQPLDEFIRTGEPHFVPGAIRVLRILESAVMKYVATESNRAASPAPLLSVDSALVLLASRDCWGVDELPPGIDADILRVLDDSGWVEARYVVMQNMAKFPGDPTPPAPSPSEWFSPIAEPTKAGGWDAVLAKSKSDTWNHPCEVRVSERGKAHLASLRVGTDGLLGASTHNGATVEVRDDPVEQRSWTRESVAKRAREIIGDGKFPGFNQLQRAIGCPTGTLNNAIQHDVWLRARHAEWKATQSPQSTPRGGAAGKRAESIQDSADGKGSLQRADDLLDQLIEAVKPRKRQDELREKLRDHRDEIVGLLQRAIEDGSPEAMEAAQAALHSLVPGIRGE